MNAFSKFIKSLRDLGIFKLVFFALYKAGLYSGYYRRLLPSVQDQFDGMPALPGLDQFPQVNQAQIAQAIDEAENVLQGFVRLFGGEIVELDLNAGASSKHWTALEKTPYEGEIKTIWEPARFGWALALARAYAYTKNPVYARDFWNKTLHFLNAHPPNLGRQWQSAQEVAIRLMVLVFCDRVFADDPVSLKENRKRLWQAIAEHAKRIYWSLEYSLAQNNNHLLAESAGLFVASLYLPTHVNASNWYQIGWYWLNKGLQKQIAEGGTYMQHSVNYHRVMLQIALFADYIRRENHEIDWPIKTHVRLANAVRWLWGLTDPLTGQSPNLGANDGAYLFPLTAAPYNDFRPVVDAGARAFLGGSVYEQHEFKEMGDWFNLPSEPLPNRKQPKTLDMLRIDSGLGKAFLRIAQFIDRPSHADQLHADLWWDGVNIAADPGTYQYNGEPPWDNALMGTKVHNTLTIDDQDQMTRAGRFLWLDWAQAKVLAQDVGDDGKLVSVSATHNGYKRLGIEHQRTLTALKDGWQITDRVLRIKRPNFQHHFVCLTWLLPNWEWSLVLDNCLKISGPKFSFELKIIGADDLNLVRAGETILGSIVPLPAWGWVSPTYLDKKPAIALIATKRGEPPFEIFSIWKIKEQPVNNSGLE